MKPWRIPLLAALIAALFVLAPVAFADCPPGNPECELAPPESEEVNPDPGSGVGPAGDVASPGSFLPVQVVIPMPLPRLADASPVIVSVDAPASVPGIEIPLRYQNPDDVSCGVQALGMALDGLEGAAPTSPALLGFLQDQGMMYDFGTGVEELAYAAQSFGYRGSYAFHGATLEDLTAQLAAGSPVVVSLGANGPGVPGHFVTVTGISADGKWVSYNDPTLGRQVISVDEFTRLWGLQGFSGVGVTSEAAAGVPGDAAPWLALIAGVMALVGTAPAQMTKRPGIGGAIVVDVESAFETVEHQIPVYGWIPTWKTIQEPVYKTVTVEKTIMEPFPVYKTVIVQDGWDTWTEKKPIYGTQTYISGYKTVTKKVPEYIYIGKRKKLIGYDTVTSKVPIYSTRTAVVGYQTVTHKDPHLVEKQVLVGYEDRPVKIQVEEERLVGYVDKQVPGDPVWGVVEWKLKPAVAPKVDLRPINPTLPVPGWAGGRPPWVPLSEWRLLGSEERQALTDEAELAWNRVAGTVEVLILGPNPGALSNRPPWISAMDWNHMPEEDRVAILQSEAETMLTNLVPLWEQGPEVVEDHLRGYLGWWREYVTCEGDSPPPEDILAAFLANSPSGTLVNTLWVTDPVGMNFRMLPGGQTHPYGLPYRTVLAWDGQIYWDASGRGWYHVGNGGLWGWVAQDGLAPYRPDEYGNPIDPTIETYGFGIGGGWDVYSMGGAAQYLNLQRILLHAGAEDALSYRSGAYVNRCGELAVFQAMGVSLETGFLEADQLYGDSMRADTTTGPEHLIPLLRALGANAYSDNATSLDVLDHANGGSTVIALVNIIGGSALAPLETEGKVIGHWVHVLSSEAGSVELYNPMTNSVQSVTQQEFGVLYQGLVVEAGGNSGE